jgi:hypothetical protein
MPLSQRHLPELEIVPEKVLLSVTLGEPPITTPGLVSGVFIGRLGLLDENLTARSL